MKYRPRIYIGHVYQISSGTYHNFEIGEEVKILDIFNDICDCESRYGDKQYIKKN